MPPICLYSCFSSPIFSSLSSPLGLNLCLPEVPFYLLKAPPFSFTIYDSKCGWSPLHRSMATFPFVRVLSGKSRFHFPLNFDFTLRPTAMLHSKEGFRLPVAPPYVIPDVPIAINPKSSLPVLHPSSLQQIPPLQVNFLHFKSLFQRRDTTTLKWLLLGPVNFFSGSIRLSPLLLSPPRHFSFFRNICPSLSSGTATFLWCSPTHPRSFQS